MLPLKTICVKAGISQQTFYRQLRDNAEFKALAQANRLKVGNSYQYGDAVLEYLSKHYAVEAPQTASEPLASQPQRNSSDEENQPSDGSTAKAEHIDAIVDMFQARLQDKDAIIEVLQHTIETLRQENASQAQQIGMLLMTLQQERQERKLLQQPKQGFWDKLFHRHKDG